MSGNIVVLAAQVLLVAGVAWFVVSPIVLRRGERAWSESSEEAKRRAIGERKARLYSGIVELDFDRDSGKISSEDHGRMRTEAMNEVLQVLREEEALEKGRRPRPAVIEGGDSLERMIEDYKRARRRDSGAFKS
jgi:flagellar biosynthesis/type III secretory pathway M-ring protein FliF/YscJ